MKMVIRRLSVAAVLCAAFAGHAVSAPRPACKQAPEIAAFADVLLARPDDRKFPTARLNNTEFAYAKIKYGGLDSTEAHALIGSLPKRDQYSQKPTLELDLLGAGSPGERLAMLRPPAPAEMTGYLLHSIAFVRAVVMDGNLAPLLEALDQDPDFKQRPQIISLLFGAAFAGTDDVTKTKLVERLEAMQRASIVAPLLASEDDIGPWLRFVREHPESYPSTRRLAHWFAADSGPQLRRSGLNGLSTQLSMGAADRLILLTRASNETQLSFPVGPWFAARMGDTYISPNVVPALLRRMEAGDVAMDDADAVAVAFLAELDAAIGRPKRDAVLAGIGMFELRLISVDADYFPLPAYFDTAVARQALLPYLASRIQAPPSKPEALSAAFPWDQWVTAAQRIRAGGKPDGDVYIAAELLQLSGRGLESAALMLPLARAGTDLPGVTAHASKMLAGLMRACGDETMGLFTTTPLYRFDPR